MRGPADSSAALAVLCVTHPDIEHSIGTNRMVVYISNGAQWLPFRFLRASAQNHYDRGLR